MGADIHGPWIEVTTSSGDGKGGTRSYSSMIAEFKLNRDYYLFGLMAGVRGNFKETFEPRGMPKDVCYQIASAYTLMVRENGKEEEGLGENEVSKQQADSWIKEGLSEVWDEVGPYRRITGPDWHSASWLTTKEVDKLIKAYKKLLKTDGDEDASNYNLKALMCIHKTMSVMDSERSPVRIVFWWDN